MDYLKLLNGLKVEFFAANKAKYNSLNIVLRLIFTIIFIPLRISFFFARIGFWLTWFFFKCLATPVDYLQAWLKNQQDMRRSQAEKNGKSGNDDALRHTFVRFPKLLED